MRTTDLILTLLIIILFISLYFLNIVSVGVKKIKDDWPKYRCNPIVMPFASTFGSNPITNFNYCIQNIQKSYMSYLLQPINYSVNLVGNVGGKLNKDLNFARIFISKFRSFVSNIFQSIFGVFLNLIIEIQKIIISFKDTMSKSIAFMITLMYMMDGTIKTMKSLWNGPPGKLVKVVGRCFDKNTPIILNNNDVVNIKNIKINDILSDGSKVIATMKISNIDNDGNYVSKLYELYSNKLKQNILVTGDHLIKDNDTGEYIQVSQHKLSKMLDINKKSFYCLITDTHKIKIGEHLFWDWEDGHDINNLINFK